MRDTGRGLSPEQQAHLYEPFNRLGAEREGIEGRGIGLMTVHHLVRLMGGRLQHQSRVGEGSEFRVWLPAAQRSAWYPRRRWSAKFRPRRSRRCRCCTSRTTQST